MKDLIVYSFNSNLTEQEKIEIHNELIHMNDNSLQEEFDAYIERENEAREAYRSICAF
jgi:hypothetical protein